MGEQTCLSAMGGATWLAAPAGVLSLVLMGGLRGRKGSKKGKKDDGARLSEDEGVSFTCERVCTSDALLTRLGGLTKVRALHLDQRAAEIRSRCRY